ncbi:integral membrane sensor signal transduction histidine kinase [Paenibacillus curdlanolyticus YK9]|uniref:histidine kinase n=1 Tax=Paenibacillus curdlanolyticus YK9 TaxID=717606 RepID=E0I3M4_9BACL|nr:sensor histidine kinase [Paenibacillus curdlanolyticus]EFM12888.1 integral membrane sensor signal transduction histidine kinase [Paenibacillus curdlanolyticus YK9]
MSSLMKWLRHLFIVIPAILTLVAQPLGFAADGLISSILLGLLAVKLSELIPKLTVPLLVVELIGFGAISERWEGYLFLLPYSTLIAIYSRSARPAVLALWTMGGLAVQLASLSERPAELIAAASLLWLMLAAILIAARQNNEKHQRAELLYERLASQHEELEGARRRLLDYAAQIEQYAQTEERNRIARDIHDDLGHRLIRVKMMSEATLHLFDIDTQRARHTVEQIRDQLQESMERMRKTVRKLAAPEEDSRIYAIDRLVQESCDLLGIDVSFTLHGNPAPLYPSMEYILYRNAQEAITNAVRHGGATFVEVLLRFCGDEGIQLTVSNNGAIPGGAIKSGLGLRGMSERAALVGGTVTWHADEQFAVMTRLPALQRALHVSEEAERRTNS